MALGAISAMQGIGAALSNLIAGYMVEWAGFNAAFYALTGIAVMALGLFYFFTTETIPKDIEPLSNSHGY